MLIVLLQKLHFSMFQLIKIEIDRNYFWISKIYNIVKIKLLTTQIIETKNTSTKKNGGLQSKVV